MPPAGASAETLMPVAVAIVVTVAFVAALPFIALRYRYRMEDGLLVMGRAVLGVIPVGEHRIRLSEIVAVERCGRRRGGRHCLSYGSTFSGNGVLLILRRRYMMYDSIRVTPGEVEAFVEEMRARGAGAGGRERP